MKLTKRTFKAFVVSMMYRFYGLPPLPGMMFSEQMALSLRDCLVDLAGIDPEALMESDLAWLNTSAGRLVKAVCDEAADGDTVPTMPTLRAIWSRLSSANSKHSRRTDCQLCEGAGFMLEFRLSGISGALPCPNGCTAPSSQFTATTHDHRALERWYRAETSEAANRRAAFLARRREPRPRVSQAEIDALRQVQERNRSGARQ